MDPAINDLLKRLDHLSAEFQDLREGIRQAITIADLDPEMSLTRARKVLEYVVRDLYERNIEPAGTRPLENLLQRLSKDGVIPRRIAAYANAVRELGNVGTHVHGEAITKQDVAQSLQQLMFILEWYFEYLAPTDSKKSPGQSPLSRSPPAELATRTADNSPRGPQINSGPGPASGRTNRQLQLLIAGAITCVVLLVGLFAVLLQLLDGKRNSSRQAAQQTQDEEASAQDGNFVDQSPTQNVNNQTINSAPNSNAADPARTTAAGSPSSTGADIRAGLRYYWPLDEREGDIARDIEGDNSGVLSNWRGNADRWLKGRIGNAISFEDAQNSVATSETINFPQLTITFWLQVQLEEGTNPRVVHPWAALNFESGKGVGVAGQVVEPSKPTPGQWQHYAVVIDLINKQARIHRNGVQVAAGPLQLQLDEGPLVFGHNQDPNNHGDTLRGLLDDVRVYDRCLSADEVAQLAAWEGP